jgi:hypothetical protein
MTDYRLALLETARSLFLGGCHSLWRREGPIGPELFMSSLSSLFPAEVSFLWSAGKSHGSSGCSLVNTIHGKENGPPVTALRLSGFSFEESPI